MCPIVDKDAFLLMSIFGKANTQRISETQSIWKVSGDEAGQESLYEKLEDFLKLVFDEFPYAFLIPGEDPDIWKEVGEYTRILPPDHSWMDYIGSCHGGPSLLYVAREPLREKLDTLFSDRDFPLMMASNDIPLAILIDPDENTMLFGFNPGSEFLKNHGAWKETYLNEIYPNLTGHAGKWLEGLYRGCFRDDNEIAFWLASGLSLAEREKANAQIERVLSEIPFPTDQIQIIANRKFATDREAKDWLKDLKHEFQQMSQFDEKSIRLIGRVMDAVETFSDKLHGKGLTVHKPPTINKSYTRPFEMDMVVFFRPENSPITCKTIGSISVSLCKESEFRSSADILSEVESQMNQFVQKAKHVHSKIIENVIWIGLAVIIAALAIIAVLKILG